MKLSLLCAIVVMGPLFPTLICAQEGYDEQLRQTYGADDYGMKSYTLVILKTGTAEVNDKAERDSLFAGHMSNISRLVDQGDLIVAGPLGKNDHAYRGIFILNTTDRDAAIEMLMQDTAISSGLLNFELFSWYGSAALPAYIEVSKKITKIKI